jgi:hypothetical protein
VFFQTDVDVHAISPQVDVVHPCQVPVGEGALLGLPLLGELGDHGCGQARGRAEELAEGRHEVTRGQAVQIQQRQHLGDLRGLARPGRQDR